MGSVNQIKITIGGPETLAGSATTMEYVVPVRSLSDVDKQTETAEDPAIIGRNMASASYIVANSVAGSIDLTPRPCGGMGQLTKSLLGSESTVSQIGALIRFKYTGSSASCKIVTNATNNTIISSIGTKGSEVADTNFGVGGTIDCDSAAYDTVDELVAAITGYTDYTAEKIFEQSSNYDIATNKVITFTNKQGKNTWVYIWFSSSDSGAYLHELYYNPTSTTEHPTYSIQKDGYQSNFLYDGMVVDSMNLSAALKGMVEGSVSLLGFDETAGQSASNLTLEDVDPLIFYNGSFSIDENDYTYIRNLSLDISQNHNPDGYGQGSTSRAYHEKGRCEITGDCNLRLDATSYAERADMLANTQKSLSFYFKGKNFTGNTVPELMLVELPYIRHETFAFTENAGVIDCTINYRAFAPKGTTYNNPITISLITSDSGTY